MNGAHSRVPGRPSEPPTDKWLMINQILREQRFGILALQETHYTAVQTANLNELFGELMTVHVSPDPANPSAARGVAFALNRRVIKDDTVVVRERVPGRAIELELTRRRGSKLTILNIYAPNDPRDNAAFWDSLRSLYDDSHTRRPDVILGDCNLVEYDIDRAPARSDTDAPVRSLTSLLTALNLHDGWRVRVAIHDSWACYEGWRRPAGAWTMKRRVYLHAGQQRGRT